MERLMLIVIMIFATGCADFRIHVKDNTVKATPKVVLVGPFDIRNLDYDPYISDEFSDALRLELFSRGFNPVQVRRVAFEQGVDPVSVAKLCADNNGDILIRGVISQRESGFLADRETATLISFTVHDKGGNVIAEGFYHNNRPAGDESFRRSAAEKIINELLSHFKK